MHTSKCNDIHKSKSKAHVSEENLDKEKDLAVKACKHQQHVTRNWTRKRIWQSRLASISNMLQVRKDWTSEEQLSREYTVCHKCKIPRVTSAVGETGWILPIADGSTSDGTLIMIVCGASCPASPKNWSCDARTGHVPCGRATMKLCSKMFRPDAQDLKNMERVGRFFVGCLFGWQAHPSALDALADVEWAGDRQSRKSVSAA